MKKILILTLLLLFVLPAALLAAETELEKIPSPDQIKYFRVVKKEDGALFGVRINKALSVSNAVSTADTAAGTGVSATTLEKISGPWDLPLFEKIKKVGSALWGYRKDAGQHLGFMNADKIVISPEIRACLKTAINTKDTALKATVETDRTRQLAAIEKRNVCEISALSATSSAAVMKDFKACGETFKQDIKAAQKAIREARETLQNTYKESLRACYKLGVASTTVVANPVSTGNVLLEDLSDDLSL